MTGASASNWDGDRNTSANRHHQPRHRLAAASPIGDDNWISPTPTSATLQSAVTAVLPHATLAGHVEIGDHVILSGFAGVHQFCRVGAHAFIGMGALINGDVPPYVMVATEGYGRPRGINSEGLKRRGFDSARIAAIKRAYRALYMSGANLAEAKQQLAGLAVETYGLGCAKDVLEVVQHQQRLAVTQVAGQRDGGRGPGLLGHPNGQRHGREHE